jgi:hypothetical protein
MKLLHNEKQHEIVKGILQGAPIISTALLTLWTVVAGTLLCGAMPPKIALWSSAIVAFILGLLFTGGAYHVRTAYLSPFSSPEILVIIGLAWATYLALPTVILAKLLSAKRRNFAERFRYSLVAAFLQLVFCVAPSIPLLIVLSME